MCSTEKTILIVDDDPIIRDTFVEILSDEGYSAATAANGKDALEKLHAGLRPCMIFLDLMMPIMTGAELYTALQADDQLAGIPVVIISADGNVKAKAAALCGDYLPKPVKIDPVLASVERHCD